MFKVMVSAIDTRFMDYSAASEALSNGWAGADRWYEYLNKSVVRLRQLVDILESPNVADGAQIKLRDGRDFSHLRRVIRLKAVEGGRNEHDTTRISEMAKLLGGNNG